MKKLIHQWRNIITGKATIPEWSTRSHRVRYFVLHAVVGTLFLIAGVIVAGWWINAERMNFVAQKVETGVQEIYPDDLVVTVSATSGLVMNATGAVVFSVEHIAKAFGYADNEITTEQEIAEMPANVLVLDMSGSVQSFNEYDTLILATAEHVIAKDDRGLQVIPRSQMEFDTPVTIDNAKLSERVGSGNSVLRDILPSLKWKLIALGAAVGLLGVFFLALFTTAWVTLGMMIVTFICRLLSKIRVTISFQKLFTGLSLFYLPVYILLKITGLTLNHGSSRGFLAMVACLAVVIARQEGKGQ